MSVLGARPVSLVFANLVGSDAHFLPDPISGDILGVKAPAFAGDNTRVLMPDGSIWEYLGIGYDIDNKERVNGWSNVRPATRINE